MSDELTLDKIIALVQQQDSIGYTERIRLVHEIESLTAERDAMRDVIRQLMLADGVPITPGATIWEEPRYRGGPNKTVMSAIVEIRPCDFGCFFSTREAAMRQTRKENDDE